jgi:hypothetical protein
MAESQVDPARLQGKELHRWYSRSPAEVEDERQAADQRRYESYFGGAGSRASADDLTELRRQQAAFGKVARQVDVDNSWFAAGALAPVAVVAGLEGAGALSLRGLQLQLAKPLNFLEQEAWQGRQAVEQVTRGLTKSSNALRDAGRQRWAKAYGAPAKKMQAQVHHSDPLQFANLKPNADPNRLANLWALRPEAHQIANREWAIFSRALQGRTPSQAELMAAKLRIDKLVAPNIRRPGTPWSIKPPGGKGGPM